MNDDFLIQYWRTPRRAFADDLFARLAPERAPTGYAGLVSSPVRAFAAGLAALVLIAATVLLATPGARAAVGQLIRTIGGITFHYVASPPDSSEATIVPHTVVSLAEARTTLPFELRLPAWAPDGYVLQEDEVRIWRPQPPVSGIEPQSVTLTWRNPAYDQGIRLCIAYPASTWANWLVGHESTVEEIVINGQPAALVRGAWEDGEWRPELDMTLLWVPEGSAASYSLSAMPRFTQVSVEDLIRMAESVR